MAMSRESSQENPQDLTALAINIYYLDIKCFELRSRKRVEVEATICH